MSSVPMGPSSRVSAIRVIVTWNCWEAKMIGKLARLPFRLVNRVKNLMDGERSAPAHTPAVESLVNPDLPKADDPTPAPKAAAAAAKKAPAKKAPAKKAPAKKAPGKKKATKKTGGTPSKKRTGTGKKKEKKK